MLDFIARRLIAIIPVLAVVAIFVFLMLRLTPGDPAAVIAGDNATSDQIADIRTKLGLDEPIWTQFAIWIGNVLQGNFGESFFFKKTVAELIAQRVEPTLALAICTLLFAVSVSVPIGVMAAYRQGSLLDRAVMGFSVLGFSVPVLRDRLLPDLRLRHQAGLAAGAGLQRIAEGWGFLER
jgi:peptide/nickel transport system permease protein